MLKIYLDLSCKKCQTGLQYLKNRNIPAQVIQFLKSPMTELELEAILLKMDMEPLDIVKTESTVFKQKFRNKELSSKEYVRLIIQNPQIIRCPIVVSKYKAVIADPPEKINELL